MTPDEAWAAVERLVKACKTVIRQWEGGHPPGHDSIIELHRALKASAPGLKRPSLDD
jgi:enoyl reductase-like protein